MKTIEQTRRQLFFSAVVRDWDPDAIDFTQDGDGSFKSPEIDAAWWAFNAALDAVVIELPDTVANTGSLTSAAVIGYKRDVRAAIESTNLGLKMK